VLHQPLARDLSRCHLSTMTLKIETRRSGDSLIVQLIDEFDVGHLDEVKAQVNDARAPSSLT
jgi:hypothetical protein